MPMYDFKNLETGEVETKIMSIADMQEYVKDPNIQQVISPSHISYEGDKSILRRAGDGWKEVQDRIKSGLPPKDRDNIRTK
mgnify:FL=1